MSALPPVKRFMFVYVCLLQEMQIACNASTIEKNPANMEMIKAYLNDNLKELKTHRAT